MKILVIGSLNLDTTYSVSHIPKEGETILASSKTVQRGGKGQNQAIQMARLGADVSMIGAVGSDNTGVELLEGLTKDGVNISGMIKKDGPSGTASIYLDEKGENNIVVFPGSNYKIDVSDITNRRGFIEDADIIVMQNEIPLDIIYTVLDICEELDKFVILNPAPAIKNFEKSYFKKINLLVPNETELRQILSENEETDIYDLAKGVLKLGCENVIVTLGKRGSMLINNEKIYEEKALTVKTVDTTGAGDSFIGGLSFGISEGMSLEDAMKLASKVSAIAVTSIGATDAMPDMKKLKEFKF